MIFSVIEHAEEGIRLDVEPCPILVLNTARGGEIVGAGASEVKTRLGFEVR